MAQRWITTIFQLRVCLFIYVCIRSISAFTPDIFLELSFRKRRIMIYEWIWFATDIFWKSKLNVERGKFTYSIDRTRTLNRLLNPHVNLFTFGTMFFPLYNHIAFIFRVLLYQLDHDHFSVSGYHIHHLCL